LPPSRRSWRSRYQLSETSFNVVLIRNWKSFLFRDESGWSWRYITLTTCATRKR
jgi:hypothetical protein